MECSKPIINRVKRSEGQIKGVLNMMQLGASSCEDMLTQLKAIRSSIDQTIAHLIAQNLVNAIESRYDIKLDDVEDELKLLTKGV